MVIVNITSLLVGNCYF